MEYPFKDLMPLDEVLEREGYYKDWTHLDPEVFYSLTQISKYIKTKGYGVDVRLLIAQLAEHFGLTTTQVVDLASETLNVANDLTDRFNQQIGALTEDSEIIDARNGYPNLYSRLQVMDSERDYYIYPNDSGNDTDRINEALNTYDSIVIRKGDYHIDALKMVSVPSNKTITFENGAIFNIIPNNSEVYYAVKIQDVENVTINNITIVGERSGHVGTTGEWGHGISIMGSRNVTINGAKIRDCWGDGFYIGKSNLSSYSQNIIIRNPICDNNRRQGISVVSCHDLWIYDPICINTNGAEPHAGIDLEPNTPDAELKNIHIINPYTKDNVGAGILVAPFYLSGSNKEISIYIENHIDHGSRFGFHLGEIVGDMTGIITLKNPVYSFNKRSGIFSDGYDYRSARVDIINPTIYEPNQEAVGSSSYYDSAFFVGRLKTGAEQVGNIHIYNPIIKSTNSKGITKHVFAFDSFIAGTGNRKMSLIDPKVEVANVELPYWFNVDELNLTDNFGSMAKKLTTGLTLYNNAYASTFNNFGATAQVNINLSSAAKIGTHYVFRVMANQNLSIIVPSGQYLIPNQTAAGKGVYSNTIGATLEIEKVSDTQWAVTRQVGTWTNVA